MNRIVQCGLVAGLLIFGAMCVGSAADEDAPTVSDDYIVGFQDGFYQGAQLLGTVYVQGSFLLEEYNRYMALSDEEKEKNQEFVSYYNNQSTDFNQNLIPYVNDIIVQVFGIDDNRTSELSMPSLPSIS